ncbi:translation initiation factor IF-2-like [Artibeus jamaicensis]|uniref:translation initiation factor IF-2-like n=1 Tax=Artibeus jamaicensis TaxID=9417 RepID=UPI00235B2841|nr:translation initiation factor IF-2-like [Artibeus jamaicensis]
MSSRKLAAAAPPPAPASPPRPDLGARRRRRRRLPSSQRLRAEPGPSPPPPAPPPPSPLSQDMVSVGPRAAPGCRGWGQRGGDRARRRGGCLGVGGEKREDDLGRCGIAMAAVSSPRAKSAPRRARRRQGGTQSLAALSLAPRPWLYSQWEAASFGAQEAGRGTVTSSRRPALIVRRPARGGYGPRRLAGDPRRARAGGHAGGAARSQGDGRRGAFSREERLPFPPVFSRFRGEKSASESHVSLVTTCRAGFMFLNFTHQEDPCL